MNDQGAHWHLASFFFWQCRTQQKAEETTVLRLIASPLFSHFIIEIELLLKWFGGWKKLCIYSGFDYDFDLFIWNLDVYLNYFTSEFFLFIYLPPSWDFFCLSTFRFPQDIFVTPSTHDCRRRGIFMFLRCLSLVNYSSVSLSSNLVPKGHGRLARSRYTISFLSGEARLKAMFQLIQHAQFTDNGWHYMNMKLGWMLVIMGSLKKSIDQIFWEGGKQLGCIFD